MVKIKLFSSAFGQIVRLFHFSTNIKIMHFQKLINTIDCLSKQVEIRFSLHKELQESNPQINPLRIPQEHLNRHIIEHRHLRQVHSHFTLRVHRMHLLNPQPAQLLHFRLRLTRTQIVIQLRVTVGKLVT